MISGFGRIKGNKHKRSIATATWSADEVPGSQSALNIKNGMAEMDEGTSTTVFDNSGNGNNGQATGFPSWTAGVSGAALTFNGLNHYVTIPDRTSLDVSVMRISGCEKIGGPPLRSSLRDLVPIMRYGPRVS